MAYSKNRDYMIITSKFTEWFTEKSLTYEDLDTSHFQLFLDEEYSILDKYTEEVCLKYLTTFLNKDVSDN